MKPPQSRHVYSLAEAVQAAPTLATLQERVRKSRNCLQRIEPLIPASLRGQVHCGPIQDQQWCLLVTHTAAATKLRQLVPLFLQALCDGETAVDSIRIKVQSAPR